MEPRLSCQFCPLASTGALIRAVRANPAKAAEYLRVEQQTGHSFKHDMPIAQLIADAHAPDAVPPDTWDG
jgi:hypothetical protein